MSLLELLDLESGTAQQDDGPMISGEPLFYRQSKRPSRDGARRAKARRGTVAQGAAYGLSKQGDKRSHHEVDAKRVKASRLSARHRRVA